MEAKQLQEFLNHYRSYPQNGLLKDKKVISDFIESLPTEQSKVSEPTDAEIKSKVRQLYANEGNEGIGGIEIDAEELSVYKGLLNWMRGLRGMEQEPKVLICENCKEFHFAPTEKCSRCESTSLSPTHDSNARYVKPPNNNTD